MFEKDAEEYVNEHSEYNETFDMVFVNCDTKKAFKDGAEFGYNKCKEEIQEKLKADLIVDLKERMQYSTSPSCTKGMELFIRSIEEWEIKEIVLPKEYK